jgi:hypothetical protein
MSLLFTSSILNPVLVVAPVGMWSKASISPLSELAREAGEAQPVGGADRPHIHSLPGKFAAACGSRGSGAGARRTKRRDNAHKIEELEVLYPWHPFGRVVHVHEMIEQRAGGVLHCSPDGDASRRWLELPQWMFGPCGMPGDPHGGLTACRYNGAHSLEDVSCGRVGCLLVRRPSHQRRDREPSSTGRRGDV